MGGDSGAAPGASAVQERMIGRTCAVRQEVIRQEFTGHQTSWTLLLALSWRTHVGLSHTKLERVVCVGGEVTRFGRLVKPQAAEAAYIIPLIGDRPAQTSE